MCFFTCPNYLSISLYGQAYMHTHGMSICLCIHNMYIYTHTYICIYTHNMYIRIYTYLFLHVVTYVGKRCGIFLEVLRRRIPSRGSYTTQCPEPWEDPKNGSTLRLQTYTPDVPPLRALWPLFDGIWVSLSVSWGVLGIGGFVFLDACRALGS